MAFVELLIVEDAFEIQHRGVVLVPAFPVPVGGWKGSVEQILVLTPDGQGIEAEARFEVMHLNLLRADATAEDRWRVSICVLGIGKANIPVGSRILVCEETKLRLVGPDYDLKLI